MNDKFSVFFRIGKRFFKMHLGITAAGGEIGCTTAGQLPFALIVASIGKGEMSVGQVKQPNWFRQPDFYAQFCEFHDAVLTEFLCRFRDNRIHSGRYVPI